MKCRYIKWLLPFWNAFHSLFFSIKKYIHIIFLNRKESIPKEFGGFLSIFRTEITVQNL
jgi:hypothetical protein